MRNILLLVVASLFLFSCGGNISQKSILVKDIQELNTAISQSKPGDQIVLANGIWTDVQIKLYAKGTADNPVVLRAETYGEVFIEGLSYLHMGGEHIVVDGLYFRNGYTPSTSIIRYRIGADTFAFNTTVTNCVIEDFTRPNRLENDKWIEFYGQYNTLSNCYISGKSNDGETIRVFQDGIESVSNHHQIVNNYFGPRPRKGGPRAETVRVGDSKTSMSSGFVNVSNNYFEACNGEVEVISDKTNFNIYKNNIFYKCEGSLVLRHGSFTTVDGNIFIGDDDSDFYGGIRVVSTGHIIANNYFYKINGIKFRSPLAVMNGIPMSPINRYKQVTDAIIAYNTWIDCKSPFQIGVGQNLESADVLPKYEIRSEPPIRSTIANNIVYNTKADSLPYENHSSIKGILFENNLIDNGGEAYVSDEVFDNATIKMKQINEWLYAPAPEQEVLSKNLFSGFNFDKIQTDVFGATRASKNSAGAICDLSAAENFIIDKKKYGPTWFSPAKAPEEQNILTATIDEGDLSKVLAEAVCGDVIELESAVYTISNSLKIDKKITIRSKDANNKAQLVFEGEENTPAFEMNPEGILILKNVDLKASKKQLGFAPLKEGMRSAYNLFVDSCLIDGFAYVLKAHKASFADSLIFSNSSIKNCENGLVLAAEEKGDYNAEIIIIDKCYFSNVAENIIHFYRGGYDESTIGGCLTVKESSFANCGAKEKSGILIKTRGIINVDISGNSFSNNPVQNVAVLWGEKNNSHSNNTLVNSGELIVEEHQKQVILY